MISLKIDNLMTFARNHLLTYHYACMINLSSTPIKKKINLMKLSSQRLFKHLVSVEANNLIKSIKQNRIKNNLCWKKLLKHLKNVLG